MVFLYAFLTVSGVFLCNYSKVPRQDAFMAGMWFAVSILFWFFIGMIQPLIAMNQKTIVKQSELIDRMLKDMAEVVSDLRKQTQEKINKQ